LLKISAPAISDSLTFLLNFSLTSGQVPSDWKKARVSAIHKKGSKQDAGNYRPISVLPVVSKIMERVVHQQLCAYLHAHNLLTEEQSGFRLMHSTQTSLHRILEKFHAEIHSGRVVGMVALDLRKAFDTVDHAILLEKLGHYGVTGISLYWFESYLSERIQIAGVNGSLSDPQTITTGVPQGSILGPLLFIVYMNDLSGSLSRCEANMYADDTAIYVSSPSVAEVTEILQDDMERVSGWLRANKLSLHLGKTVSMLVASRQRRRHLPDQLSLTLNDNPIEPVTSSPYLGVTIDQNLTFNEHIDGVVSRASRALGALRRASRFIPQATRATVYNTLVLPHLDYCSTVWGSAGVTKVQRLQKIQNRGMRIVLQAGPRTHIIDMLRDLRWLSIKQRIIFLNYVLIYKILNGLAPPHLSSVFVRPAHRYASRSITSGNLYVQRAHPKSLTAVGTNLWNALPVLIRNLPNLRAFKRACTKHIATTVEPL